MELLKNKTGMLLSLAVLISSCEKIDFTGMLIPEDSADQRFEQSIEWNNNHPASEIIVSSENYSVLSMGDSHVGNTGNMDIFFNRAKSLNQAVALLAGDLTNGRSEDYKAFQNHLPDKDTLPVFPVAGNHDMNFGGWERYYSSFGSSTFYFTVKTLTASDVYICLETGGGTLGKKQIEWLTSLLKTKRSSYRHCFVVTHNNFFRTNHTTGTYLNVEEMYFLMDLFTEYRVNMVITAHDHRQNIQNLGGTTYLILPALTEESEAPGYLQMDINETGIDYRFVDL